MREVLLLVTLLAGCGAASTPARRAGPPTIIEVATGRAVSFESMIRRLANARVVYVGERHDRAADHEGQRAILQALYAHGPSRSIGLEMIQRPYQPALDAYVAGSIDEAALLSSVEWSSRWGYDFAMYRPLLAFAREHRQPIVALNAPTETTRAIARGGLDALDAEARAQLPELNRDVAAHRARVAEALSEHPSMDDAMLDRFYTAQLVWDETMAEVVAQRVNALGESLIVFAGGMHVMRDAIPARAARRGAASFAIVLFEDEMPVDAPADYVWLTGPGPEDN